VTVAFVVPLLLLGTTAYAGPCSSAIAQFEQTVRQSANSPTTGPTTRQTIGAQLDHQPTPGSVERAEARAQATFEMALARAKRLNAQGHRIDCMRALGAAKRMFDLQ
jgi:hypothetical protein